MEREFSFSSNSCKIYILNFYKALNKWCTEIFFWFYFHKERAKGIFSTSSLITLQKKIRVFPFSLLFQDILLNECLFERLSNVFQKFVPTIMSSVIENKSNWKDTLDEQKNEQVYQNKQFWDHSSWKYITQKLKTTFFKMSMNFFFFWIALKFLKVSWHSMNPWRLSHHYEKQKYLISSNKKLIWFMIFCV